MNIIKFKNIQLDRSSGLTSEQIELFNTRFSGKYARTINWTWCLPMDQITDAREIELSRELCKDDMYDSATTSLSMLDNLTYVGDDLDNTSWKRIGVLPQGSDIENYKFIMVMAYTTAAPGTPERRQYYMPTLSSYASHSGYFTGADGKFDLDPNTFNPSLLVEFPIASADDRKEPFIFYLQPTGVSNEYYIIVEGFNSSSQDNKISYLGRGVSSKGEFKIDTFENGNESLDDTHKFKITNINSEFIISTSNFKVCCNIGVNPYRFKPYSTTNNTQIASMYLFAQLKKAHAVDPIIDFAQSDYVVKLGSDFNNQIINQSGVEIASWRSSNIGVATVDDNGNVSTIGEGECIISATTRATEEYNSIEIHYNLKVRNDFINPNLHVVGEPIRLKVGEDYQIEVQSEYDDFDEPLTFSTTNSNIVVNEHGYVVALKPGNAVVHIKSALGEKYDESSLDVNINVMRTLITEEGEYALLYDDIIDYIDTEATERANSTLIYDTLNNSFDENGEIPLELLKKFRTWLAVSILAQGLIEDEDTIHMLKYYAGGMYDDIVKVLNTFGVDMSMKFSTTTGIIDASSCGCANGMDISQLSLGRGNICDPLTIYRQNIYKYMVNEFSSIKFWQDFSKDFMMLFKAYIDGIINVGLPLSIVDWQTDFVDCSCLVNANTAQDMNLQRLKKLSIALGYIIDDEVKGHKNYIGDALTEWATYLYERMEW